MRLVSALLCASAGLVVPAPLAFAQTPLTIVGPDDQTRRAILDILPDRERPASLFDAERIAEEAAARARTWLRSEGYYAATVTPDVRDEPPLARLIIEPGARFRFDAPLLSFDGAPPDDATREAVVLALNGLHEGEPARAAIILHAEAEALAALQSSGYADAAIGEHRVTVDHATARVAAELRFNAGAAFRLGDIRAEPEGAFRPGFLHGLRNWRVGDAYSPEALARLRRDLASTGAVSRIGSRLAPADEDGVRDVVLELEPAKRNAYELGLGYSTTEGAVVEARWTRRNLTGRADALTLSTTLGEIQQDITATLARPHGAGLGHTINFGAALQRETSDAFTRQGASLLASVDASTRLRIGRSYGARLSADRFDDLAGGVRDALVLSGFAELRYDTTEFSLDPRDGAIFDFRIEPSVSAGDASLGFVRAIAEARGYESFGERDRLTLAGRVRGGWLESFFGSVDDVPPDRRFYAGGGGSIRGYSYNSIYPHIRDDLGLSPGGQGLFETSLEARWRFDDKLGAALFVDGGAAFDDLEQASDLTWGAGIGVRYDLGFAPLRIDVAFPLDAERDRYALYISIGQAF
ncbi:MAG: autotransporter assembly complex family protein [Terricaulis sp.]